MSNCKTCGEYVFTGNLTMWGKPHECPPAFRWLPADELADIEKLTQDEWDELEWRTAHGRDAGAVALAVVKKLWEWDDSHSANRERAVIIHCPADGSLIRFEVAVEYVPEFTADGGEEIEIPAEIELCP